MSTSRSSDEVWTSPEPTSHSTTHAMRQLIRKDWYLLRWLTVASLITGFVALGLVAGGGGMLFYMGSILLVTVLIAHGAILASLSVVEERQNQTLPFIMSLPVSPRQYAAAKISANLVIFGTTWCVLLLGALGLVLLREELPNGLLVYAIIILTEILMSTCLILAVAMVSQSVVWTISTMMVGNLVFNGFLFLILRTPDFVTAAESTEVVWPPEALSLLFAEFAAIAVLLTIAFVGSTRRKDIL